MEPVPPICENVLEAKAEIEAHFSNAEATSE
jgi:hypothetical protein